jgi:hypothetical protein
MSLKCVELAEPCKARQVLYGRVLNDPFDGREKLWLTNMCEEGGGEIIAVDFKNDTAEAFVWPAGHGSWNIHPLPGDRLAISTYYDGVFIVFDMKTREFPAVIDFPGESYIWEMATGSDGRVYGCTYNGAKLGCFDPKDYSFEDLGSPDEGTGNLYLRTLVTTPGGDIACTAGYEKNHCVAYRIAEKRFVPILPDEPDAGITPLVTANGYLYCTHADDGLIALKGAQLERVELPLPPCLSADAWGSVARYSTDERVYLTAGTETWCWQPATNSLENVMSLDLRGGSIRDVAADGTLVGVRGQDYFVSVPGSNEIDLRPIKAETRGRHMHFLVADPEGEDSRVWAGPPFGQTVCSYDTQSGAIENTGSVVDAGGEVYGAVFHGGKLYTASYAGADFAVYDPDQPWDQWNGTNPVHIASLREYELCRPTGRMFLAPDGMMYSGWQSSYGVYGGALARLNPETHDVTVWNNPLGDEAIGCIAVDDRYAYLGSNHSANGLSAKEGDGQFGVFDLRDEKLVYAKRMDGMAGVGCIGVMPDPRLVFIPEGDTLHVFDADAMEFREDLIVEIAESPGWGEDVLVRDGSLIFGRGNWFVTIRPDLSVEVVGPLGLGTDRGHMTLGPGGAVYIADGSKLCRVDGL